MAKKPGNKPETPPPPAPRSRTPLVVLVVAVIAVAGFLYARSGRPDPAVAPASAGQTAAAPAPRTAHMLEPPVDPPESAAKGPHLQMKLPPIEIPSYSAPRTPEVIRAAYRFAAEHPEVLSYVPCFCGCERMGHRGNEDCFVRTRDDKDDVTEWEPHGMECTVCIDVATEARQMYASGASVKQIRAAIEKEYAPKYPTMTPTAAPPAGRE